MKFHPPGARIAGRYEIASRPLMGGMGIVYVCLDHEENRPVALKTFKPEYLPDRAARDRFLREGTAWVDLGAHPHVVRCYRVLHTDPEVYLVLELVAKEEGRDDASLRSWLVPGRPLQVEQALLFALQIARGMAHATATIPGFVHRDLKPENVLVGADHLSQARVNRVRVTDFGLAAVLQEVAGHQTSEVSETSEVSTGLNRTQLTHGIVGTPLYMAPEQWKGERVDLQTDVYALGCILYEMVAGQRAVVGSSLAALRRAHCQGEVRPLPQDLSAEVGEVMARCLAVEPGERYVNWAEVEKALAEAYVAVTGATVSGPEPVAALGRAERVAAGWSYNAMGLSYRDIGKVKVALGYLEHAREVGQSEGERLLEASALNGLGLAYTDLGDMWQAIRFFEQALAICREIGDGRGEGNALGNLGIPYGLLGEAQRAIGYFEQALAIFREIGDWFMEGTALGNLGEAYRLLGEARRAIGYYEQALVIAREIGDWPGEGRHLCNLGEAYRRLGDVQRSIGFFERALAICRGIGNRYGEGAILHNLGNAYASLGVAQQAIAFLNQRIEIAREIGDRKGMAFGYWDLGLLYEQQGNLGRAVEMMQICLDFERDIGHLDAERDAEYVAQLRARLR